MKIIEVKNIVLEKGVHYLESPFGERKFAGSISQHNGVDLIGKGKSADYVISIDKGVVKEVSYSESRGYYIGIKMENGYTTRYLHLKKGSIIVKKGQSVKKGQRIAYMGNTGYYKDAQGKKHQVNVHLHFAVVNTKGNFVDPMPYLKGEKNFNKGGWVPGYYRPIKEKYMRTSPEVKVTNKVKWSSLNDKYKALSYPDVQGKAKFRLDAELHLLEFKTDSKGYVWARCETIKTPIWLCVEDNTGKQVESI